MQWVSKEGYIGMKKCILLLLALALATFLLASCATQTPPRNVGVVGFFGTRWGAQHYLPLPVPAPAQEPPSPDEPASLPSEQAA